MHRDLKVTATLLIMLKTNKKKKTKENGQNSKVVLKADN